MAGPTATQRIGQWLFPRLPVTRFLFDLLSATDRRDRVVGGAGACVEARR
jgi:hypothetical protein